MTLTWRILSSLLLCASLSFGVVACGDDDGGTAGDGDGDGDGDVDAGDGDGDVDAGDGDGDVDAGPAVDGGPVTGECTNSADLPIVQGTFPGGPDGGVRGIGDVVSSCGSAAFGDPAATETCVDDVTDPDLSETCMDCFLGTVSCAAANCLSDCVKSLGGTPEACAACRCGANEAKVNCVTMFTECSGIPSDDCDTE